MLFADQYSTQLIILDEIQRLPDLFAPLRVIIDQRRRAGQPYGQFLLLGSASLDLLGQTSESLAGRVAHAALAGIDVLAKATSLIFTERVQEPKLTLCWCAVESRLLLLK